jgi:hypothetical protein
MKKTCFAFGVAILLCTPLFSSASIRFSPGFNGAGFRLSLVVPEWYDVGFGLGVHADISILEILHFYPSFEYSHAGSGGAYYELINGIPFNRYLYLNEFALNGDLRLYPPVGSLAIKPFAGGGLAFIVSDEYYSYVGVVDNHNHRHDAVNEPGLGLDMLCGCDIPMGNVIGTVELKVKLGTGYTIFKVTGGLTFPVKGRLGRETR